MPYIEDEPEVIKDNDRYTVERVGHKMSSQCVAMKPADKYRIRNKAGSRITITVEGSSGHVCRKNALEIAEERWPE